jgi:hypothetical protein
VTEIAQAGATCTTIHETVGGIIFITLRGPASQPANCWDGASTLSQHVGTGPVSGNRNLGREVTVTGCLKVVNGVDGGHGGP